MRSMRRLSALLLLAAALGAQGEEEPAPVGPGDLDLEELDTVVLPVWTKGLYSTLRGFMAIEGDANTVRGITFYEDGETPGLGGEINNPRWQSTWSEKQVFDDSGAVRISVNRSQADPLYDIDALSGATLTSRGVDNMLRFWMGGDGYGPFLEQLKASGANL